MKNLSESQKSKIVLRAKIKSKESLILRHEKELQELKEELKHLNLRRQSKVRLLGLDSRYPNIFGGA